MPWNFSDPEEKESCGEVTEVTEGLLEDEKFRERQRQC